MKRLLLLAMLLIFGAALLNVTNIYAATEYSQTPDNYLNTSIVQGNTTNDTLNNETIQNSTGSVNENATAPVNNTTAINQLLIQNASNSSQNSGININNSNKTDVQNSTDAAGDEVYKNVRGIWLKAEDVSKLDVNKIKKAGITDIFIKSNILTAPLYPSVLKALIAKLKNTNIRIHAWITCFKDANGKWIDPLGKYSYKVKVPDKKIKYKAWYKSWYKSWYKYKGKWSYKWKYKWKYVWKYKYTYKYKTKYGYNTSKLNSLITSISKIVKNYNIDGIHLDYIRYPGTAYKHPGGTEAITSFVQKVYNTVKSIKPKVAVSAALMPECSSNAKYYGQDYTQLSKYLDFLVPMIYKGNYNKNTTWIGSTTKWIVEHSGGKPVIAGLQTYKSDGNIAAISAGELNGDIKSATNNGASGYVLFRYGLITDDFFKSQSSSSISSTKSINSIKFTLNQIKSAAAKLKSFIQTNHRLPNYVTIGKSQVTMPDMLRLMTASILQLNSGIKTPVTLKNVNSPADPTGDLINGTIKKSEYLKIAKKIKSFIDSKGIVPNYATSSLGDIQYDSLVYMYSKILGFHKTKNRLPSYVTIDPIIVNSLPSDLQQYLQPTENCQSDDSRIKSLASLLTKGISSTHSKGVKLFNWVRDNLSYSFYYNTRYGAVNTYRNKTGNCVDHSHLLIALARAAGIPARYAHGKCTFTSGNVYGHVWAQFYVNGKWYNADAISSKNSFGAINNWDKDTVTMKGIYSELPF